MKAPQPTRTTLTPPMLARRWGISPDKVLGWIRSGELRAMNVAKRLGARPRYLIDVADLAIFEARRAVVQPAPARRRRNRPAEVTPFF